MSLLRSISKPLFAVADRLVDAPHGPRILIYHQVGAGLGRQMEVTPSDFEWQLQWLSENCDVVDLDTAASRWHESDTDRLVVLTFDDGYMDTYTTAWPLLREFGFPFTLYLSTEHIGGAGLSGRDQPLGWGEIESMMSSGRLTLGAHTHRHTDLRTVTTDQAEEELETSDGIIDSRLGVRPRHFAYPWGYWSESADPVVRRRYVTATLGAPPLRRPSSYDPHMIYRFPVQLSDGRRWFRARLSRGLVFEEELRRRIRRYRGP